MADGSQWFEPYRRTADTWWPRYRQAKDSGIPCIFLHELNFEDGFPLWRYRKMEYFVWTTTLGEFDEGVRGSVTSPAIIIQSAYNQKLKDEVGGIAFFQREMKESKVQMIKGVDMHVAALGCVAHVFMVFHGMEGDAPARTEAACMKRAGGATFSLCHMCHEKKDTMADNLRSGICATLRNQKFAESARHIQSLCDLRLTAAYELESKLSGINGYSRKCSIYYLVNTYSS